MADDMQKLRISCAKLEALRGSLERKCKDLEEKLSQEKKRSDELEEKLKAMEEKIARKEDSNAAEDNEKVAALMETLKEKELALHEASSTIEEYRVKCESLEASLDLSNKEKSENDSRIREMEDAVIAMEEIASEKSQENARLTERIAECERELPKLQKLKEVSDLADTLRGDFERKKEELERLKKHLIEQENAHTQEIIEYQKREADYKEQLEVKAELEECVPALKSRCDEWQAYGTAKEAECQKLNLALQNLQSVLEELQSDQERIIEREVDPLKAELRNARAETEVALKKAGAARELEQTIAARDMQIELLRKDIAEKATVEEEAKMQIATLRASLDEVARKMEMAAIAEENNVDKRVVKKMLVTFVARPGQRHDILELMSRMLDFTEEDKEVCGLSRSLIPPSPSGKLKVASQKSLGELWVDFLLNESGGKLDTAVERKT